MDPWRTLHQERTADRGIRPKRSQAGRLRRRTRSAAPGLRVARTEVGCKFWRHLTVNPAAFDRSGCGFRPDPSLGWVVPTRPAAGASGAGAAAARGPAHRAGVGRADRPRPRIGVGGNRHIVPALGRLPLAAVERRHVMELHEKLCETPAMANMTVKTLTHMYALARDWGSGTCLGRIVASIRANRSGLISRHCRRRLSPGLRPVRRISRTDVTRCGH